MKSSASKIWETLRGHYTTQQTQIQRCTPLVRQVLVASGPLVSTISLGMTSGYSAILLPQLQAGNSSIPIDQSEASWIASMAVLPMAFGCLLGGFLMEKLGRRTTQILTTIPCLVGWSVIALSRTIPTLLVGRFLTGLCGGLLGPTTGVYISETSEPKYRGFLLGAISLAVALGLLVVHLLGTFLPWTTTAAVSAFLPIVSLACLWLVPESPSWLAKNKRVEEAQKAFFWCRDQDPESKKEVAEMIERQNLKIEAGDYSRLLEKEFLRPLAVIVAFVITNQWSGVNALTFYTVTIMRDTLSQGLDEYLAMLIVDVIRVFMSVFACVVMKTMGRRPLAQISGFGTFLSLFVLSGYTYSGLTSSSWYCVIPMMSLIAYISFISIGFVPLPWAMMGEVFPLNSRNVGSSISSFAAFSAFFTVVKTGPAMFDGLGTDGTFLVYGVVALVGTVINYFFLPETKDKTLGQIEDQLKA